MIDIVSSPDDLVLFCLFGILPFMAAVFLSTEGKLDAVFSRGTGQQKYKKSIIICSVVALVPYIWTYVAICLQLLTGSQW